MSVLRVENKRLTFVCDCNKWYFIIEAVERVTNGQVYGNYGEVGHTNIMEVPATITEMFRIYNATWKVLERKTEQSGSISLDLAVLEVLGNNFDTIPTYKREESINC